ncbi:16S rRNA (guanine527-N7)-methyltransferase [Parasphingorhabdus marina DSM 22363]|uniref:Ribosomal RNA small subunit methyltransferase G n=1 Tax=Parasphingorhabdus marina DSM 22363 TaxID=1123272 RepID=A0A1N6CP96_9SPHN|nr:16S rRNA (guanine(527)-N(7))-methyltransferase RsmG [Parasphingorhabdus marina]SIN60265.1 16S rRNA (guanine527-N7)-methyltransferase [Parasphingorhabdus marina DSM 22363]
MNEAEAQAWLRDNFEIGDRQWQKLEQFLEILRQEMAHQNLISKASAEHVWARHVVDSAQLLLYVPEQISSGTWLDLGTGAGFPGIIIAILGGFHVQMVESRARRIAFLQHVVDAIDIGGQATVQGSRLEVMESFPVDVISARAFAPLGKLLSLSHRFSTEKTLWLLPKGKNAVRELQELSPRRRKMFHVEQSVTDAEAGILVGTG